MDRSLPASMALMMTAGLALGADDFARLAPPEAGLVVNVSNYARSKERLLATPLGRLNEQESIAAMLDEARGSQMASFDALATELGIDVEEWPEPEGMVGLAIIATPIEGAEMWEPQVTQSFVAGADFGDRIAQIRAIVDAVVEKGLDQGLIQIEAEDVGGIEVLTIDVLEAEAEDGADADPMGDQEPPTGLAGLLSGLDAVTLAIDGSTLYLGTQRADVIDMVDRARGADVASVTDDDSFAGAMAQHPEGTDDYLVAFPGRLGLVEGFELGLGFFMPPGMEIAQILGNLGIINVKALSLGATIDGGDAQVELTLGVLDAQKTGLVSLLDVQGDAWVPPAFVTPDAVAATRLLVDFARLPEVAREFWATMPPEFQGEGGAMFEQVMAFVEPIAPLLGPEVHLVQTLERPFTPESAGLLYVIPTSDELPLRNLLVLGAGSGVITPRDFGESKVYDMADGSGLSFAVAYGQVFIGLPASVESGLRLAAAGGGDGLAQDDAFSRAMAPHPSTGNALQFTRARDILEFTLWSMQNLGAITRQQLLDSGWTAEEIEEYGMATDLTPEWAKDLTIDMFERGVGDVSMEIAPSDDGFRGRILFHAPR